MRYPSTRPRHGEGLHRWLQRILHEPHSHRTVNLSDPPEAAADRWWNEHGSTLKDFGIKSALDRLVEIMGGKTYLHAITGRRLAAAYFVFH